MKGVPISELQALDVDLSSCSEVDIIGLARRARIVRGFLDSFDARLHRQLTELKAAGESSGATPSEVLGRASGESSAERARRERRADALDDAPEFDDALTDGSIVAGHVDAFAAFLADLDGDVRTAFLAHREVLLADARHEDVGRFRRRCRDLITRLQHDAGIERARRQRLNTRLDRKIDPHTGMYHLHGCFDPETGARLWSNIDTELAVLVAADREEHQGMDRPRLAACALAKLVARGNIDDSDAADAVGGVGVPVRDRLPRPANVDVVVHVDWKTLCAGLHELGICELDSGVPIPAETARRLACDAHIMPIVMGDDGVPLDHGRGRRQASRAQRRALRAMYPGCAFPGCEARFDRCEMHHLTEWEHLGDTDLRNLLPLCSYHHHRVHEDGWQLSLDADRTLIVRRPDGTIHGVVPVPSRERHAPPRSGGAADPSAANTDPPPGRPAPTECERPPSPATGRRRSTPEQYVEQLRLA